MPTLTPTSPAVTPPQTDVAEGFTHPPLDIIQIMSFIPHRYPFLLIDAVTEHKHRQSITGYKMVTMNEPFFQGHFPGRPIMPGVLQVEALAQLGGVLLKHLPEGQNKLAVFTGIEKVRFRRMVVPGDKLDLYCELTKMRAPIGKAFCRGSVNGDITVEGEMMFSLVDEV